MNVKQELEKLSGSELARLLKSLPNSSPFVHEMLVGAVANMRDSRDRYKRAERELEGAVRAVRSAVLREWTGPQLKKVLKARTSEEARSAAGVGDVGYGVGGSGGGAC